MEPISRDFTIDLRRLRVLRELEQRGTVAATAEALHLTPSAVSQQLAGSGPGGRRAAAREARPRRPADRPGPGAARARDGRAGAARAGPRGPGGLAGRRDRRGPGGRPVDGDLRRRRAGDRPACAATARASTVRAMEDEPPQIFTRLDAGDVDIVIAADYRDAPSRHDPHYHRVDLLTDRMDAVLPQGHPLANPDGVRLADFAAEPWVGIERSRQPCAQITLAVCAVRGVQPGHPARQQGLGRGRGPGRRGRRRGAGPPAGPAVAAAGAGGLPGAGLRRPRG